MSDWQVFGLIVGFIVILAGFWAFIERTFVRIDVQKERDKRVDEKADQRHAQLQTEISSLRETMTDLPSQIQNACILGVTEGARIVRAEVRAARAAARLPIRRRDVEPQ